MSGFAVVLLGPPGAGKSTQGDMLARRYGLRRIASGELLHAQVRASTARGAAVRGYLEAGELVPDALVVDIVAAAIADAPQAGVVLDGFPRHHEQARLTDRMVATRGWTVRAAIDFRVDAATVRARLSGRRARDGRVDDDPVTVERRLQVAGSAAALLAHYRHRDVLRSVDADQPIAAVSAALIDILDRDRRGADRNCGCAPVVGTG